MGRGWILAIDFGTTNTCAAIAANGRVDVVEVGGGARMPSAVFLDEHGTLIVGAAAEAHVPVAPDRAERTPKKRVGDTVMVLGDKPVRPVEAVAAVLSGIAAEAVRRSGGQPPTELRLTHPARWGSVRLAVLAEAARLAALPEPVFVPEPVAAALYFADERVSPGAYVAVYDLGGGTFDTAVLRRTPDGFEVAGPPGGSEHLGGELFDERLLAHLGERLAETKPEAWESLRFDSSRSWRKAAHDLRLEVRRAKEALSAQADYTIYIGAPVDVELLLTREEVERLIRPDIDATVDELLATVERAGLVPGDLAAVNIVGGSSRIPLVTRLVAERFGRVPDTWGDPKAAVVLGAASAGQTTLRDSPPAPIPEPAVLPAPEPEPPVTPDDLPTLVADDESEKRHLPIRAIAAALVAIVVVAGLLVVVTRRGVDTDASTRLAGSERTTTTDRDGRRAPTTTAAPGAVGSEGGEAAPGDPASTTTTSTAQTNVGGAPGPGPEQATTTTARRTTGGGSPPVATTTSTTTKADVIAARSVPAGMKPEQNRMVRLIPDDAVRMSCRPGPGWNQDADGYVEAVQCSVPEGSFYLESYATNAQAEAVMASFNRLEDHPAQTGPGCSASAFYYDGTYSTADNNPDGRLRCLIDGDTVEIYWTDSTHRILGWIWRYDGDFSALFNLWASGAYGFDL